MAKIGRVFTMYYFTFKRALPIDSFDPNNIPHAGNCYILSKETDMQTDKLTDMYHIAW